MILVPLPNNEVSRLQALYSLNILDTSPDVRLDCITRFLAQKLELPICLITLIDAHRQWFKSAWGFDGSEISRTISICAHAIFECKSSKPSERVAEIYDLKNDIRFFDNPFVKEKDGLRSYISYVIQSDTGLNIGTLCLVGKKPRAFSDSEKDLLIVTGKMVENILNGYYFSKGIENEINFLKNRGI